MWGRERREFSGGLFLDAPIYKHTNYVFSIRQTLYFTEVGGKSKYLFTAKKKVTKLCIIYRKWTALVSLGDASCSAVSAPMTVGQVAKWTPLAMMLVLTDLYAYTGGIDSSCLPNSLIFVAFCSMRYVHKQIETFIYHDYVIQYLLLSLLLILLL